MITFGIDCVAIVDYLWPNIKSVAHKSNMRSFIKFVKCIRKMPLSARRQRKTNKDLEIIYIVDIALMWLEREWINERELASLENAKDKMSSIHK